jgi:hypothetical protein
MLKEKGTCRGYPDFSAEYYNLTDYIETLSDKVRVEVRDELVSLNVTELPRNLYYNYETQRWI